MDTWDDNIHETYTNTLDQNTHKFKHKHKCASTHTRTVYMCTGLRKYMEKYILHESIGQTITHANTHTHLNTHTHAHTYTHTHMYTYTHMYYKYTFL